MFRPVIYKRSQRIPVILIHGRHVYNDFRIDISCLGQFDGKPSGRGGGTRVLVLLGLDADRYVRPFSFRLHAQGLHIHAVGQCQLVTVAAAGGEGDGGGSEVMILLSAQRDADFARIGGSRQRHGIEDGF